MSEQKILATVDGVNITEAELDAYIKVLPQDQQGYAQYPQFREHCLKQMVAFHLYAKMAVDEKMDETEEFKDMLAKAKKEILAQMAVNTVLKNVAVSEEEVKAYYDANAEQFKEGETAHAKHILVDSEEKALEIMDAIVKGETAFEDAAREFSSCPSNAQGADLGEFGRGQMVREFDQVAFEAEIGQVVGPVKTQFGYHLVKVENRKEASVMAFDEVKSYIEGTMLQQKQNEVYTAKYNELYAKYMD